MKYYRHKIENLLVVNKIVTIHDLKLRKGFSHGPERHDFWELVYANKGNAVAVRDGERLVLRQGEAVFHRPDEAHCLIAEEESNVVILSFECSSEALRTLERRQVRISATCKHYLSDILEEARATFRLPEFDPELRKLELCVRPRLGGQQMIRIHLEALLIHLLREIDGEGVTFLYRNEYRTSLCAEICDFLRRNVASGLDLDQICKHFGYGKTRLCTLFAEVTGVPVMKYYSALRIEEAKKLLASGLTVAQTADALHFDTPNYFSKTFRKTTGQSPSAFRRTIRS